MLRLEDHQAFRYFHHVRHVGRSIALWGHRTGEASNLLHQTLSQQCQLPDHRGRSRCVVEGNRSVKTDTAVWSCVVLTVQPLTDLHRISVLVPSHTIRGFHYLKQKSLGIAYVDFKSDEDCAAAKKILDGIDLNGRTLRAKQFIPYSPGTKMSKYKARRENDAASSATFDTVAEGKENAEEGSTGYVVDGKVPSVSGTPSNTMPARPISDVTLYIGRLPLHVGDGDLRQYLHDYIPTEVYVFKSRSPKYRKHLFHHRIQTSALITLSAENGLARALDELKDVKLKGKKVLLQAAYISKVEEVRKAAQKKVIDDATKDEEDQPEAQDEGAVSTSMDIKETDNSAGERPPSSE